MESITKNYPVFLVPWLFAATMLQAQEPTNKVHDLNIPMVENTSHENTLITYNQFLLDEAEFRFRKEIKKVKLDTLLLKYNSQKNRIHITKVDYLKLVRRLVNQSDTEDAFIKNIMTYFPEDENAIIWKSDFRSLYKATRMYTFYGYFDGLPDFNY